MTLPKRRDGDAVRVKRSPAVWIIKSQHGDGDGDGEHLTCHLVCTLAALAAFANADTVPGSLLALPRPATGQPARRQLGLTRASNPPAALARETAFSKSQTACRPRD